jgi:hypothetical protein
MNDYRPGNCMLCLKDAEVRHINLYIIGSEGLNACHSCEMKLVEFARNLMAKNGRLKMKIAKKLRASKLGRDGETA